MIARYSKSFLLLLLLCVGAGIASAQSMQQLGNFPGAQRLSNLGTGGKQKKDSLQKRDFLADSITIFYRYFDSTRNRILDSSINDFTTRFPLPSSYYHLGNYGTAANSFLFNPLMKAGFDAGFHQYDVYKFTLENTRFYQTTRPYTEFGYVLGSKAEQLVDVKHTQNRKTNFNFGVEYRFSNSPGMLKNQNASHNNFRFTSHYQTNNRKYEFFLVWLSNKAASSENGGLVDKLKIDSLALNDPYELETRMGRVGAAIRNPFNTGVTTGNVQKESLFLFRHHLDFGKKDSIVTDSMTYKIFYPRFRVEHTFRLGSQSANFTDKSVDSVRYARYFNYITPSGKEINFKDSWTNIQNEFSLITFPDKNNQSQFFKAGIALQNLKGSFDTTATASFHNIYAIGEYRNRTRNQVWDLEAGGQLYLNGMNSGDYSAIVHLKRLLGKKTGFLHLGFQNVNRSPSFILNPLSSFPVSNKGQYNKENIIRLFADYENPGLNFKLSGEYFAVSNYMYFDSFFTARQEAALFNVLHIAAEKKFRLSKHWNWYAEVHVQQTTGKPPVNLPALLTRHRLAFEGNFYTNLFLSTGLELRYSTAYQMNNYSPMTGQFFYQTAQTISNRPDIHAFLHFRIKSFKGFIRVENLNTLTTANGSFSFSRRNFTATDYPAPTLWTRVGIWWNFVN